MHLTDLANFIRNNKKFISGLAISINNFQLDVTNYAYDNDDMTFYLMADDGNPVSAKDILKESYRYPADTKLAVICEEFNCIAPVKSFSTQYGEPSFGEPNLAIIHI